MELKTDTELMQEYIATKSEKAAFELVKRYKNFVFATALRYSNSYDDAEDIAQETFIKALNNLHKFQGKSSFKTWLYRIAVNTFFNTKKRRNIKNVFSQDTNVELDDFRSNQTTPEQDLEYEDLRECLMKALNSLPKRQKEVFSLRFFEEMKYEEIAGLLNLTVGGLKADYYHAIRKIINIVKKSIK